MLALSGILRVFPVCKRNKFVRSSARANSYLKSFRNMLRWGTLRDKYMRYAIRKHPASVNSHYFVTRNKERDETDRTIKIFSDIKKKNYTSHRIHCTVISMHPCSLWFLFSFYEDNENIILLEKQFANLLRIRWRWKIHFPSTNICKFMRQTGNQLCVTSPVATKYRSWHFISNSYGSMRKDEESSDESVLSR